MRHDAEGLAANIAASFAAAGVTREETSSPLSQDELAHSVWLPLTLLYGATGIPTVIVSIQGSEGPAHHARVGEILRPVREQGALVLGSGSLTHNHREIEPAMKQGAAKPWAAAFVDWMRRHVVAGDLASLINYRQLAPFAQISHPEQDHLLPLFVACGAGSTPVGAVVHEDFHFGAISMGAYSFT
jgi:4,5-DOPA dioxygenase extradiol